MIIIITINPYEIGAVEYLVWLIGKIDYYNKFEIEMYELSSYPSNFEKGETDVVKLYEQIVVKNFQILKSILPKMNSLYQFNEQLERNVSRIQTRLIKMENDHQNLHYQMRTSHLAIDSKLNGIMEEYNNITNQTSKFKKQAQFLTKEIRETKNRQKSQQNERRRRQSQSQLQQQQLQAKAVQNKVDKIIEQQKRQSLEQEQEVSINLIKRQKKYVEFVRKKSTSIENDDSQVVQSPKVHFNLAGKSKVSQKAESVQAQSEHNTQIGDNLSSTRKTNLKGSKSVGRSQKLIKVTKLSEAEEHNKKLDKLLKQIENYHFHNEKMKKNYQELIQQYQKANELNFAQVGERITELNNRFNNLHPNTITTDKPNNQLSYQLQSITKSYAQLQAEMSNKIDRASFEKLMNDFNIRFFGIHQERKKLANRDQTKKALEFLQKKVNSMLSQYYQVKRKSLHHVSVDKKGCLRVQTFDKQGDKQLNRENIIDPHQTQTIRHDRTSRSKRPAESLHARIANGTLTEDRFNQNKWRPICTQKVDQNSEAIIRKQQHSISLSLLKKKSYQILEKDKVRVRPRLKKQRLIFQYD